MKRVVISYFSHSFRNKLGAILASSAQTPLEWSESKGALKNPCKKRRPSWLPISFNANSLRVELSYLAR